MEQKLIKSRMRVRKHGEVFTPAWMVEKMLNVGGITESCNTIDATFLEPAAGSRVIIVTTAYSNDEYWVSSPLLEEQKYMNIIN